MTGFAAWEVAMYRQSNVDFYLLPTVASATLAFLLVLGFLGFAGRGEDDAQASRFVVDTSVPTWNGEPRMPRVETRFRKLRPN